MPRFIFGNLQGLSGEAVSKRFALVAQLLIENNVDVTFLCEVMLSSRQLGEARLPVRPSRFGPRHPNASAWFDEELARVLAQNEALRSSWFEFKASYRPERYTAKHPEGNQKGYGTLSTYPIKTELVGDAFEPESTRAPLRWIAPDGTHVYVLHAISNHAAARRQLHTLIGDLRKAPPGRRWMIVGDLNCPPGKLFGEPVKLSPGSQALPLSGTPDVFVCIPDGPTRWKSDNLLDYVISNMPCRVVRLPQKGGSRPERQAIDVLEKAGIDHRLILVESLDPNRDARPSKGAAPAPRSIARVPLPVGFQRKRILGDGNCLFRAIGFLTRRSHEEVRAIAVNHLLEHWDTYEGFVSSHEHAADLAVNGVWAGHVALVAVARELNIQIVVHRVDGTRVPIHEEAEGQTINLYYTDGHYDALVEQRPGLARRAGGLSRVNARLVFDEMQRSARDEPEPHEVLAARDYVNARLREPGRDSTDARRAIPGEIRRFVRAFLEARAYAARAASRRSSRLAAARSQQAK